MWRTEFGTKIPNPTHVCGIPLRVSTDCPPGRLYLTDWVFHVHPDDQWSLNDFQSTLNRHRKMVRMPQYIREDRHYAAIAELKGENEWLKIEALKLKQQISKQGLEIEAWKTKCEDETRIADGRIQIIQEQQQQIERLQANSFWYGDVESYQRAARLSADRADRLYQRLVFIEKFVADVMAGKEDTA